MLRWFWHRPSGSVGVAALLALLAVVLPRWWPWDGYRFERDYGFEVKAPLLPDGWYFAPFLGIFYERTIAEGLRHVFYAFVVQLLPFEYVQERGCVNLTPDPAFLESQLYKGFYLKGVGAAARALRRYPNSKALQAACIRQVAMTSLFNRYACAAVERAGIVDLSLAAFRRFRSDPGFQNLGDLGCFFDHCPRNAQRFRELGGIPFVHEIIQLHNDSGWVMFMAFCAYASGCLPPNRVACASEPGLVGTMVQVMRAYREGRVREEVMQVVKNVAAAGPEFRGRLLEAGMLPQLLQVLEERVDSWVDQSVACEAISALLGFDWWAPHLGAATFRPEVQALMAEQGALGRVVRSMDLSATLTLPAAHGGQNEGALRQYDIERSCSTAVFALAAGHRPNQGELVRLGAPAKIVAGALSNPEDKGLRLAACAALHALEEDGAANRLAVEAAGPPSCTGVYPPDDAQA